MAEARIVSPNQQRRRYRQVGPPATLAGHPHSQPSTRRLHRNALRELHSLPLATPATPPERNIGTLRTEPRNALFIGEGAPCVEPREPLVLNCGTTLSLSLSFHLRRTSETFFFPTWREKPRKSFCSPPSGNELRNPSFPFVRRGSSPAAPPRREQTRGRRRRHLPSSAHSFVITSSVGHPFLPRYPRRVPPITILPLALISLRVCPNNYHSFRLKQSLV